MVHCQIARRATGLILLGLVGVLSRQLTHQGIYPPISVLPSLSRLMKDGIGEGHTRADHSHWSAQLYASYAYVQDVRALSSVIGEEELSTIDQQYLKYGQAFEREFIQQRAVEERSMEMTLEIGWKLLRMLPKEELTRLSTGELERFYEDGHGTS